MTYKVKPMGDYMTNCYIVETPNGQIIIDPGMNAMQWVCANAPKPLAILNTHGHFDHIFSNAALQEKLKVPLLCPKGDVFMLLKDPVANVKIEPSVPSKEVLPDEKVDIGGVGVTFHHFAGHTPGCSAIEIGDWLFSGDFIFADSIGRTDFPFSSSKEMIKSLKKFMSWKKELKVLPGHGGATSVQAEQKNVPKWIEYLS